MFRHTIPVFDLNTRKISDRPSDTVTFDVPADFDRSACVATVDSRSCAHYLSISGSTLVNRSQPRPLSWRARGEECLVARARSSANESAYRLCSVDPR